MVDDQDQQPTGEAQDVAAEAPAQAPRRRRRAASRPAGPPVIVPGGDQAGLFETPEGDHDPSAGAEPVPGDQVDSGSSDRVEDEPLAEEDAVDEPLVDENAQDEPAQGEPVAEGGGDAVPGPATGPSSGTRQGEPELTSPTDTSGSARRSRRATRGVTTVAFSAEPEPEATPVVPPAEVPVVALFQPPDETKAVRRRRRPLAEPDAAGTQADETAPGESRGDAQDGEPRRQSGRDQGRGRQRDVGDTEDVEDTDDTGEAGDADDDRDDDGTPRRRRRRGGRRRRRGGSGSGEDNGSGEGEAGRDDADSEPTSADDSLDEDSQSDENDSDEAGESSSARRRRRRRRRAGVAEEMEDLSSEDPPNTVVKVREARRPRDEITSVRGSTRIEAKKQRRRDGREAGRRRAPILTEAEFLARREAVNRVMCVREHGDRTQIAVLEDGILVEHYVNRAESSSMVGNVYLGKVQNVLPSMEAAFVDIGRGRNAVLYAGEVNWEAAGLEGQPKRIELALKSGDPVLVQVTKDPIGHKGARLTSQISLPGRFLVYVPEGSMTGISRKLPDTERSRLKSILKDVVPDGAGVIVRTAAEGASEEQLTADVTRLAAQWADITKKAKSASPPSLLYGEPDLAIKVVRDIFNEDFTTLLVQGDTTWQTLSDYIGWVAPDLLPKLEKWVEPTDLYAAHRIDEQLAKALDRKVWLPSGGSLVIDRTEAMTVVDVNTGKFTGQGGNLEETVTKNNLEAAEEIVRQLRLRDIGGIIVVDFIDMVLESNRDLVLRRLVECLGRDRTKHQVAEVTSLGLVQMTRKRIGQGLLEVFSTQCEHCGGRGHLVHAEPVGLDHQTVDEGNGRRDRGGRRATKVAVPAILGGKQTGKTPPPPRFDEQGHIEHDEHVVAGDAGDHHGSESPDDSGTAFGHEPEAAPVDGPEAELVVDASEGVSDQNPEAGDSDEAHEHGEPGDVHGQGEHGDQQHGDPDGPDAHGDQGDHQGDQGDPAKHDELGDHHDHHDPHESHADSEGHDQLDAV